MYLTIYIAKHKQILLECGRNNPGRSMRRHLLLFQAIPTFLSIKAPKLTANRKMLVRLFHHWQINATSPTAISDDPSISERESSKVTSEFEDFDEITSPPD